MSFFANFFKKKNKTYKIEKEQENCLVVMLCSQKAIKLSNKIIVPENFCAVIFSKEKLLDIIPSGEYEITGLTCPKVCKLNKLDKPTKKGYKQTFDADFFFVNSLPHKLENKFYIKKLKQTINFSLDVSISKSFSFLKFLTDEKACFDNTFAENELTFYISQLIYYYILDTKLYTFENLLTYLQEKLSAIGIKFENLVVNFEITNTTTQKEIENTNLKMLTDTDRDIFSQDTKPEEKQIIFGTGTHESSILDDKDNTSPGYIPPFLNKSSLVSLEDITSEKISYFTCDNCGAKLPSTAQYCFKCKKSFIEKHTCENCGKEIPKNTCVCPYCNSVILE